MSQGCHKSHSDSLRPVNGEGNVDQGHIMTFPICLALLDFRSLPIGIQVWGKRLVLEMQSDGLE